jgi:rhodanese-related sulfurtransferase
MSPFHKTTALRGLALAGLAGLAALISNGLASPSRRLAWQSSVVVPPSLAPQSNRPASAEPLPRSQVTEASRSAPPSRSTSSGAAPNQAPSPAKPAEAAVSNPIREISGQEAWVSFQSGVPFLDARRRAEFAEGHIAGAWCTPVWEADLPERLIAFKAARQPGPDDPIVIYCSGGDCQDSHLLAAKLLNEGYGHLLIYRDGFPDWMAQKRPVEKGQP